MARILLRVWALCLAFCLAFLPGRQSENYGDYRDVQDCNLTFEGIPKSRPVVTVIGDAGVGKTTFVHFMTEPGKLKGKLQGPHQYVISHEKELIKHDDVVSQTMFPESFYDTDMKVHFVDNPGWKDNRGECLQIRQARAMADAVQNAQNVKIVILLDYNRHADRCYLVDSLSHAARLIKSNRIKAHAKAIGFVWTKAPAPCVEDKEEVNDLLLNATSHARSFCKALSKNMIELNRKNDKEKVLRLGKLLAEKSKLKGNVDRVQFVRKKIGKGGEPYYLTTNRQNIGLMVQALEYVTFSRGDLINSRSQKETGKVCTTSPADLFHGKDVVVVLGSRPEELVEFLTHPPAGAPTKMNETLFLANDLCTQPLLETVLQNASRVKIVVALDFNVDRPRVIELQEVLENAASIIKNDAKYAKAIGFVLRASTKPHCNETKRNKLLINTVTSAREFRSKIDKSDITDCANYAFRLRGAMLELADILGTQVGHVRLFRLASSVGPVLDETYLKQDYDDIRSMIQALEFQQPDKDGYGMSLSYEVANKVVVWQGVVTESQAAALKALSEKVCEDVIDAGLGIVKGEGNVTALHQSKECLEQLLNTTSPGSEPASACTKFEAKLNEIKEKAALANTLTALTSPWDRRDLKKSLHSALRFVKNVESCLVAQQKTVDKGCFEETFRDEKKALLDNFMDADHDIIKRFKNCRCTI